MATSISQLSGVRAASEAGICSWRGSLCTGGCVRLIRIGKRDAAGLVTAALVGALPALAFPAPAWWWLAWIGVIPLLMVVRSAQTAVAGGLRAWSGLAGFVLVTQYWLAPSMGPLIVLYAIGLGALWVPFGWAAQHLLRAPPSTGRMLAAVVVLPSAWVVAEAIRSWHHLGGQWAPLGSSQWIQPATMASASVGGVWLTSYLIVAVNTALTSVILGTRPSNRVLALGIAGLLLVSGPLVYWLVPAPPTSSIVRVALVQPGNIVDSGERRVAAETLTAGLAGQRVDLVVWGESSVGVDLAAHPEVLDDLSGLASSIQAPLLVNVDAPNAKGEIFKSSVLIGPGGELGSYSKVRLVPFGEYVPLRPLLGWVTEFTKAADPDRQRGSGLKVLHAGSLAVGPLISFETTFSDLPRREVQLGAELLAYQSSTSTYQTSWAQLQLASQVAVHAVEVGRPAVHAGSSGVSSAFDARGRMLAWYPATASGVVVVEVPLTSPTTIYQRFGNWVVGLCFSVLAGAGIVTLIHYVAARRGVVARTGSAKRAGTPSL